MATDKTLMQLWVSNTDKLKWQLMADMEAKGNLSEWIRTRLNEERKKPTLEEYLEAKKKEFAVEIAEAKARYEKVNPTPAGLPFPDVHMPTNLIAPAPPP